MGSSSSGGSPTAVASNQHHLANSGPVYLGNGHLPSGHGNGNGHAHAPLPGDQTLGVEMRALETMPMLTRLPENEMSDAKVKGGGLGWGLGWGKGGTARSGQGKLEKSWKIKKRFPVTR